MSVSIRIKLTPPIERLVKRLGGDLLDGIRAGLANTVAVVEARAVREAPVRTSHLVNSITSYITDGGLAGVIKATANYAEYVHEGTKPHVIVPREKKALFWPGARHPVRKVKHPGTKPNPFFERAIRRADPEEAFEEGLFNYLRRRGH